jgi:hypothetical protein
MGHNVVTPNTIKNHEFGWMYEPIWQRVHRNNQMFSCLFSGKIGSGKTYASIRMGHILDRNEADVCRFNTDNIVFDRAGFLSKITQKPRLPRGTVIIFDDCGTGLHKQEFHSKSMIDMQKVFETLRIMGFIVLLTVPEVSNVDKTIRELVESQCQMDKSLLDYENEQSVGRFRYVKYAHNGKLYRRMDLKQEIRYDRNGLPVKFKAKQEFIRFNVIPKEVAQAYEDRKAEYFEKLYSEIEANEKFRKKEKAKKMLPKTLEDLYYYIIKNKSKYSDVTGNITLDSLSFKNIPATKSKIIFKRLEQEGHL